MSSSHGDGSAFEGCQNIRTIYFPNSIEYIANETFSDCENLSDVYYNGFEMQWKEEVEVGPYNGPLLAATMHYMGELQPTQPPVPAGMSEADVALHKKYHSILFISSNETAALSTWYNYHLVPSSRPAVTPPEPQMSYVNIPGSNGALDFSESLDNQLHYGQRTGSWEFYVVHEEIENYDWTALWKQLLADLHGKYFQIMLTDEEEIGSWYYFGRVWLDNWHSDSSHSKVVIKYNLEPFRYQSAEAHKYDEGGSL